MPNRARDCDVWVDHEPLAFRTPLASRAYVRGEQGREGFAMTLATTLRTPFRPRTIVPSGAAGRLPDASLRRALVVARTVLAILCAARAAGDWLRGHATIEGAVALLLVLAFATWLAVEAIGRELRASVPLRADTPYRSSMPRSVGAGDDRAI